MTYIGRVKMKKNKIKLLLLSSVISISALSGCSSMNTTDAAPVSPEGMDLVKNTRSTIAYTKADVDWSQYSKVYVKPSVVAFKDDWQKIYNRDHRGTSGKIRDEDMLKIKQGVAKLFDETFTTEFMKDSKFTLADKIEPNTLVMTPAIINLNVNAPDIPTAGMVRTYVDTAGSATLYLEIHDAVSGEIIARIMDAQEASDKGFYQWANRVTNRRDAMLVMKGWAKALREKFDEAQAK